MKFEEHKMEIIAFSENDSFVFADKSEGSGWELWNIDPDLSDS